MMQKRAQKGTLTPRRVAVGFEKSMTEQARRKEAKICEKEAVDPSWYCEFRKNSAEKLCKMSKQRQKWDRHPPWGFVMFENENMQQF